MSETTSETTTETAGETSADTSTTGAATESTTTEDEKALGDAGKQALDRMKAERNAAREQAKTAADELARLKAEAEGKQAEYAAEQKTREVESAALAKANDRILKAEVRVAAATKLNDPADALLHINLSDFEVGSDGEVDATAIGKAIDDLIARKPYLAAQGGKKFQGSADGGARNGSTASIDDQIAEATKAGNHQLAIALKQRRAADLAAKKS